MSQVIEMPYGPAYIRLGEYYGGALAVVLENPDGEMITKLSVNLPEHAAELGPREFFARVWGENDQFVGPALASGLFEDTGRRVRTGYVEAQVWRIKSGLQELR